MIFILPPKHLPLTRLWPFIMACQKMIENRVIVFRYETTVTHYYTVGTVYNHSIIGGRNETNVGCSLELEMRSLSNAFWLLTQKDKNNMAEGH